MAECLNKPMLEHDRPGFKSWLCQSPGQVTSAFRALYFVLLKLCNGIITVCLTESWRVRGRCRVMGIS